MEKISLGERILSAWNAFRNAPNRNSYYGDGVQSYSYKPDRPRFGRGLERSIISSILTRIAVDCVQTDIKHVMLDENGRYKEDMKSGLNNCLTLEANVDQSGFDFRLDMVFSLLDEGVVALVPTDTDGNPYEESFEILELRTAKIKEWFPNRVRVEVYNEHTGIKEEIILPKSQVAIIQNPLYAIMNEPNSTLSRLNRKLVLLDKMDESASSGKLDLIVQLPYSTRANGRKAMAEQRRKDIEDQLTNEKYGIAYIDASEKITQLNRPIENQLLSQIEYLTNLLFSQLGMTQSILDGTADEQTMLNYYQRTINPIIQAIVSECMRKFIGKTARTRGQSIMAFRDPFRLVPVNNIAEIADKFTRNEILSSNEIRQIIGMKPSDDPKADELINSNLNHNEDGGDNPIPENYEEEQYYEDS